MVRLVHSSSHWKSRCIYDTSSDENSPPNIPSSGRHDSCSTCSENGTQIPPWNCKPQSETPSPPARPSQASHSPTTSSPVLLTPPRSPVRRTSKTLPTRHRSRNSRQIAEPYARPRPRRPLRQPIRPDGKTRAPAGTIQELVHTTRSDDVFVPARWPWRVAHLRTLFNPLATVFPAVPHFGWCDCSSPCRVDSCRNSLMHVYCTASCCPYEGRCGNGLQESTRVYLAKNQRTGSFGVVAAEDIGKGEVLGQYLGEIEHVSASRAQRPRNLGYRLVLHQRPEKPDYPIRAAINAETMGGLMRFVNHSCRPVAKFMEVGNGRCTTVIVATTRPIKRGQEVTVDYGDDLWFVCRCGLEGCRHQDRQEEEDP